MFIEIKCVQREAGSHTGEEREQENRRFGPGVVYRLCAPGLLP